MDGPPPALARVLLLMRAWHERHGEPDAAFAAMIDALLRQLDDDRLRYSDVFEPSLSADDGGLSLRRFSYAFPGFRSDPVAVSSVLREMAAPFGGALAAACERVLRAARHVAVAQPLIGIADDAGGERRIKLYLQFHDGASVEAAALTQAMVGAPVAATRLGGPLHMLGLDLSPRGLGGAKLYVAPARPISLARFGLAPARVLTVHGLRDPTAGFAETPDDVDFGLAENDLAERELFDAPALRAEHGALLHVFDELRAALPFALRVRRVSLGLARRKMTIYYVIAE